MMTIVEEILLGYAPAAGDGVVNDDSPDWQDTYISHDWRNHIPDAIRDMWPRLSQEARAVAFVMAVTQADAEEHE